MLILRCDRGDTSLVFDCRRGHAELAYAGAALPPEESLEALCNARARGRHEAQPDRPMPPSLLPQTGWGHAGTPAIMLTRHGQMLATHLALVRAEATTGVASFEFSDPATGVAVTIMWRICASGLVVADTSIASTALEPVTIDALASLVLPLPAWADQVERSAGRWAGEMQRDRRELPRATAGSASFGGRPGFGGASWIRFEERGAGETAGLSLATHLAWSGDAWSQVERDADGQAILLMGARFDPGEVTLAPGERWTAPRAFFAVTQGGRAAARQAFHAHVISETLPRPLSTSPRKVHLNSWEALGFNLHLGALKRLADDAAALGVERFVLDDGWFAGRRNDRAGLGDWRPDSQLFPGGLSELTDHIAARGMDFGLWVEPEMISPDSDLYRANPDWCLHVQGAERPTQRHQLVLDLTRPEVSDHLFTVLDGLLGASPIVYLKWDHNRDLFPRADRGHAQTLALYVLLDRLRAAHPRVEIETCASGGGRVDLAILERCTRYWASDNNDALERLRINRGWFDFLPLQATGNHVGPSPNPITGRRLPMDFRAKVAMFGHMGVETDPSAMSAADRLCLATHIALYKDWRDVLHNGRIWAIGCGDPGVLGWLAFDGDRGLALAAQTAFAGDFNVPPVRLFGLVPNQRYRVRLPDPWPEKAAHYLPSPEQWREGLVLSGRALADVGLALPLTYPETAWVVAVDRNP